MLSSSSTISRIAGSAIIFCAAAQARSAAATSRARSCVSQVKPSPIVCHSTWSPKRSIAVRSPVCQAPLLNCTTPQRKPRPSARSIRPNAAVDLPLPLPVWTISRPFSIGFAGDLGVLHGLAVGHLGLVARCFVGCFGHAATLSSARRKGNAVQAAAAPATVIGELRAKIPLGNREGGLRRGPESQETCRRRREFTGAGNRQRKAGSCVDSFRLHHLSPRGRPAGRRPAGRAPLCGPKAEALEAQEGDLDVQPVECLSNCTRSCTAAVAAPGKWTYVVGHLDPDQNVSDMVQFARLHRASADGLTVWRDRPVHVRKNTIARVPPMPPATSRRSRHEHARQGALHHRHRLPRRRQDHAGPPRAGECRRPPPRRDRQRVRRCRHRRRDPEELRRRELPRGRDRRARQRLHLLHRRRRFRAGAEEPARPRRTRPSTSSSRPRASRCPSRWSRPSTGRRSPRASRSTAWSRWSTAPPSRPAASPTIPRRSPRSAPSDQSLDHDNPLEEVFEDQLLCADLVILNKADLMSSARAPASVTAEIGKTLPRAVKVVETAERPGADRRAAGPRRRRRGRSRRRPSHHDLEGEHDHDDFDTFIVDLPAFDSPQALVDRIAKAADGARHPAHEGLRRHRGQADAAAGAGRRRALPAPVRPPVAGRRAAPGPAGRDRREGPRQGGHRGA